MPTAGHRFMEPNSPFCCFGKVVAAALAQPCRRPTGPWDFLDRPEPSAPFVLCQSHLLVAQGNLERGKHRQSQSDSGESQLGGWFDKTTESDVRVQQFVPLRQHFCLSFTGTQRRKHQRKQQPGANQTNAWAHLGSKLLLSLINSLFLSVSSFCLLFVDFLLSPLTLSFFLSFLSLLFFPFSFPLSCPPLPFFPSSFLSFLSFPLPKKGEQGGR